MMKVAYRLIEDSNAGTARGCGPTLFLRLPISLQPCGLTQVSSFLGKYEQEHGITASLHAERPSVGTAGRT